VASEIIILVIDDSTVCLTSLYKMLSRASYIVFPVTNVSDAAKILETKNVNLAIYNVDLGFSNLEKLRLANPGLQFIAMASHPTPETVKAVAKAGAKSFLVKPLNLDRALKAVKTIVPLEATTPPIIPG
jgi:DNA-binding NtrC family response regulator